MKTTLWLCLWTLMGMTFVGFAGFFASAAEPSDQGGLRKQMQLAHSQGNYKDAYEGFRKLALDPQDDPRQVGNDLNMAVQCLQHLNRIDEIDAFCEEVIEVHKDNWRLLCERRAELHERPAPRLHRGGQVRSRQQARRREGGQRLASATASAPCN